jgi:phosphopantetheine--protein transferase-like protein
MKAVGDQAAALRSTLAGFLGISPETLTTDFSFRNTKLSSSIQRAMLYGQLRSQVGLSVRGMPAFDTFGALEAQLLGRSAAPFTAAAGPRSAAPTHIPAFTPPRLTDGESPIACGIDIESVAALPVAADYWEHDFYSSHFTREEIAGCLLQSEPRVHLAGRWCVKEALKKCDPQFLTMAMNEIEVRADAAGAPVIWDLSSGGKHRVPYAVSLSHTSEFAIGAVVRVSPAAMAPASAAAPTAPQSPTPQSTVTAGRRGGNFLGLVGFLFGLIAMAMAAYSMWRTH